MLCYIVLHYTILRYTTKHYILLQFTTLYYKLIFFSVPQSVSTESMAWCSC